MSFVFFPTTALRNNTSCHVNSSSGGSRFKSGGPYLVVYRFGLLLDVSIVCASEPDFANVVSFRVVLTLEFRNH